MTCRGLPEKWASETACWLPGFCGSSYLSKHSELQDGGLKDKTRVKREGRITRKKRGRRKRKGKSARVLSAELDHHTTHQEMPLG